MGYLSIPNLYKNQEILMLKECYAMEKIHGSSAHISWKAGSDEVEHPEYIEVAIKGVVNLFCGGCKKELFNALWDIEDLKKKFLETGLEEVTIYGEGFGGKMQGMSATYGKELKFVAFDVKIGHCWLDVPKAEEFCKSMGIEFVAYEKVSTSLEDLDRERDKFSRQALRNGIEEDKIAEGVVLRPLIELKKNNGARLMAKHKRDEFMETKTSRKVQDPIKMKILSDAKAVADEWVTIMRLNHVLDKIENPSMQSFGCVIKAMLEDIKREGDKEIVWSKPVERAIGQLTGKMLKQYFQNKLKN